MAVGGSAFGYSNGGIAVENVQCSGSESSLEGCTRSPINSITVAQCQDASTNTAGVICIGGGNLRCVYDYLSVYTCIL